MPEFLIDFADVKSDGSIIVHDTKTRKKPISAHENVRAYDERGNSCYGFVDRFDDDTHLYWLILDRSTYASAII